MKILLISDTHGELNKTKVLIQKYSDIRTCIHLGDIGFSLKELSHFQIVRGNHDREHVLPIEKIIEVQQRRILCIHGNMFDEDTLQEVLSMTLADGDNIMDICMQLLYAKLAAYAKKKDCDTLFFGHTHHQFVGRIDGVELVNPGSVCFGTPHSGYAIVEIENNEIQSVLCKIEDDGYTH